jgi:hypothetical protein
MGEGATKNPDLPDVRADEQERIRRQAVDEFERLCDCIGAEAQARGLTEQILNEILSEEPTAEEAVQNQARLQEFQAVIRETLKQRLQRPKR